MVDSILSVDSVVVTGGPSTVKVSTDFGPQGDRGSYILYGLGNPNTLNDEDFPQSPLLLDWYINLSTTDAEYLYLYQFVNQDGIDQWIKIFKILPNVYNTNESVTFTDGIGSVNLLVSNTTAPLLGQQAVELNSHVTLINAAQNPISCSFAFSTPDFNPSTGNYETTLTIKAVEYNMTTGVWAKLSGSAIANISINVV